MKRFSFAQLGLNNLRLEDAPRPSPGPEEILIQVRALSLNFRDLLIVKGLYNPNLRLPVVPISDGAGVVIETGPGVSRVRVGDAIIGNFVTDWLDGRFLQEYTKSTLGVPLAGLAAEYAVLPERAAVAMPNGYDFAHAATLPIAALTSWSALVSEGHVAAGQSVLTLGTGGVSIFSLQLAQVLGAKVAVTSSSDEKLSRARDLGADLLVNYKTTPAWEKPVLEWTGGVGVDVTVENGGPGTLDRSIRSTRAGGMIALLGALTGLEGHVNTGMILMKRLRVQGIMVDSRASLEKMIAVIEKHGLTPVIDRRYKFEELPAALRYMEAGQHFGKIVIELD